MCGKSTGAVRICPGMGPDHLAIADSRVRHHAEIVLWKPAGGGVKVNLGWHRVSRKLARGTQY